MKRSGIRGSGSGIRERQRQRRGNRDSGNSDSAVPYDLRPMTYDLKFQKFPKTLTFQPVQNYKLLLSKHLTPKRPVVSGWNLLFLVRGGAYWCVSVRDGAIRLFLVGSCCVVWRFFYSLVLCVHIVRRSVAVAIPMNRSTNQPINR